VKRSITDRFQTHTKFVYGVISPEKPGGIINRLRKEQVRHLRSKQKIAKEISEQTGFSESYVWKVWNQPNE
jgi:hypothetical protein